MQLAETGPTPSSKISARADLDVRKVNGNGYGDGDGNGNGNGYWMEYDT